MKQNLVKLLLIEDDEDDVLLVREYLNESGSFDFEIFWEPDLALAREKILHGGYDIFLIDYRLGNENGLDIIKFIKSHGVLTPSIILTGHTDLNVDIDASRYGVSDYLTKMHLSASVLEKSIRYALSQAKVLKELDGKEKKYRSLFQRSIDPIFLANDALILMDVNDAFFKLLGYSYNSEAAITIKSMFTNEADFDYFLSSLNRHQQINDFEVSLTTKAGLKKLCLLNCVFIPDEAAESYRYQGIIHDLTQRKHAENNMLNAELLSLSGKMARTIAHEVRNPLTNLNLALYQLRTEIPMDNESAKLYEDIIQRSANRIGKLVDELLNSSRPKELNLQLSPVKEILVDTISMAVDRLKLNKIELISNIQPDLPRILVDKEKIQVAFLNIIINAIEAMEPGVGILTIDTRVENKILIIGISDNGKGIPEADLTKLFDPFFTAKPNGKGLGLTSTKNIFNSHSAEVDVQSELQKGTTFSVRFKLTE